MKVILKYSFKFFRTFLLRNMAIYQPKKNLKSGD